MDWSPFAVSINGFLMPLIAVVTLVNNALVLAILLRRQMLSPTNALLGALAVSDTLTSVCPTPCFVYFYTTGQRYLDWVPYSWCFAYFCLTDYLPTVFHTASIWLTVSLAVQRYVNVCRPVDSALRRRLCSMRGVVFLVGVVYAAAVASQACRLAELTFSPVRVPSLVMNSTRNDDDDDNDEDDDENSRVNSTRNDDDNNNYRENGLTAVVDVTACRYELTPLVAQHETLYFSVYYWSRVLLIHVVPCCALVVLNGALIRTMREAHRRRCQMQSRATVAPRRLTVSMSETPASQLEMRLLVLPAYTATTATPSLPPDQCGLAGTSAAVASTRATMMLVVVVGVFLLVEVPLSGDNSRAGATAEIEIQTHVGRSSTVLPVRREHPRQVRPRKPESGRARVSKCRCPCCCCWSSSKTRSTRICSATRLGTRRRWSLTAASPSRTRSTSSSTAV